MEDYQPQRVTGPGSHMLTQPLPTQQNTSLLASSCFTIILRDYFSDYILCLCSPRNTLLPVTLFFL